MTSNEQQIIIKSGERSELDVNIGTDYQGISHILFLGNISGKKLKIYKWSEYGN